MHLPVYYFKGKILLTSILCKIILLCLTYKPNPHSSLNFLLPKIRLIGKCIWVHKVIAHHMMANRPDNLSFNKLIIIDWQVQCNLTFNKFLYRYFHIWCIEAVWSYVCLVLLIRWVKWPHGLLLLSLIFTLKLFNLANDLYGHYIGIPAGQSDVGSSTDRWCGGG